MTDSLNPLPGERHDGAAVADEPDGADDEQEQALRVELEPEVGHNGLLVNGMYLYCRIDQVSN